MPIRPALRSVALPVALPALLLAFLPACQPAAPEAAGPEAGAPAASGAADATPAARLGGTTITVAEVDEVIKEELFLRASEGGSPAKLHEIREEALLRMVSERIVDDAARERGVSPEVLMEEAADQAAPVTDEDVEAFFEENADRLQGSSLEELRERIREGLQQRARAESQRTYVEALRESSSVEVLLVRPRIRVDPLGPSRGNPDAPVTIVEFSDYQCPYCKRAETTVRAVLDRFPNEVRYVYRHFPLESIHPQARDASEAAVCADEQGRFWDYHDLLFEKTPAFEAADLEAYAEELGLDLESFRSCIARDDVEERVEQDLVAGRRAGVRGTPAFFVNGISLSGNRPLEDFVEVIQEELDGASGT